MCGNLIGNEPAFGKADPLLNAVATDAAPASLDSLWETKGRCNIGDESASVTQFRVFRQSPEHLDRSLQVAERPIPQRTCRQMQHLATRDDDGLVSPSPKYVNTACVGFKIVEPLGVG
jgi:hypothetical protein